MKPKYHHQKTKRNKNLVRYKREHPTTNYTKLGNIFHISRQFARQLFLRDSKWYPENPQPQTRQI